MMFGTGYIRDPIDPRDRLLRDLVPLNSVKGLGDDTDLARFVLCILDQQDSPGCVGFSTAQAIRVKWCTQIEDQAIPLALTDHDVPLPSASWVWWHARQATGREAFVEGTHIRDAFKRVAKYGVPDDRWWPSANPLQSAVAVPGPNAFRHAWDLRVKAGRGAPVAYYRIDATGPALVAQCRAALALRFPLVFGVPVDLAFMAVRTHTEAIPLPIESKVVGGHAMVLLGGRDDAGLVVNSWGKGWGNRGFGWMDWRWFSRYAHDVWAVQAPPPIWAEVKR